MFSYDQVAWLYEDATEREYKQTAFQTELNYQALVVSLCSIFNQVLGSDEKIPESLGVIEAFEQKDNPEIQYFTKNSPDVLEIF
jgi:hypothetical protein